MSPELRTMTLERRPAEEIREVAIRQGMRRLREDGLDKVGEGRTSIAEVAASRQLLNVAEAGQASLRSSSIAPA